MQSETVSNLFSQFIATPSGVVFAFKMVLKSDQKRVRDLLKETITLLCKNGLTYKSEFCIDALIGITLDQDDVFLISIKETIKDGLQQVKPDVEPDTCMVASPTAGKSTESSSSRHSEGRLGSGQSHFKSPHHRPGSQSARQQLHSHVSEKRSSKDTQSLKRDLPEDCDASNISSKRAYTSAELYDSGKSHEQPLLPDADNVVVIKEEVLSDPELDEVQLGSSFDFQSSDFGETILPDVSKSEDGSVAPPISSAEAFAAGCSTWCVSGSTAAGGGRVLPLAGATNLGQIPQVGRIKNDNS